jgi:GT2 family glycosyltransferase
VTPVSVVIVLHDSADSIADCLASIPSRAELVVVDNASTDGGASLVKQLRPEARVVELEENRGFGAGCNAGARVAEGGVVVFLNPDATLEPGALERLEATVRRRPLDIVGPAIFGVGGELRAVCRRRSLPLYEIAELLPLAHRWLPSRLRRDLPREAPVYRSGGEVAYLQGACLGMRRSRFLDVGGFDERFFLYSEEEDLCDRMRAAGSRCIYEPRAAVRHRWGTSTAKTGLSATFHLYRSRVLLYRKRYGSTGGTTAGVAIAVALLTHSLLWPIARALGSADPREPRWSLAALRGVLGGTVTSLQ